MSSTGSTGNVIAAIASFVYPGLGQLVQGRILAALIHFMLATFMHIITLGTLGWIVHIYSCYNAACYEAQSR